MNQPSLKRTDTERSRSSLSSPTRAESSQIMSLVEALKIKTHELDSKVDYIKSLEVDLAQEKRARENAESRALKLSGARTGSGDHENNGAIEEEAFEPPLDSVELMEHHLSNGTVDENGEGDHLSRSDSMATIRNTEDTTQITEDASSLASRLQAQLDLRNKEMNEMKLLMESYRQRAEEAEDGRRTLAEMVENIRAGRDPKSAFPTTNDDDSTYTTENVDNLITQSTKPGQSRDLNGGPLSSQQSHQQNGSAAIGNLHRGIEKAMSNVLEQHPGQWGGPGENGRMVQSAPYVSMVGVVLIGVGLMTWLNGWQPGGDK